MVFDRGSGNRMSIIVGIVGIVLILASFHLFTMKQQDDKRKKELYKSLQRHGMTADDAYMHVYDGEGRS